MTNSYSHTASNWQGYLSWKARKSHTLMAWCGVVLFPAFGLLDYFMIENWEVFVLARLSGTVFIVIVLLTANYFSLGANTIAHLASQTIIQILMWMLSRMTTAENFFIYSLNTSTAYIASAIFLLWHPRHSVFLVISTFFGFALFGGLFSQLSFGEIISNGSLPLLTIVIMSQLFVNFKYTTSQRDFLVQAELNEANLKLQVKNHEIHNQNTEILKQKEDLEGLNDLKDRLLMIISHDFRSPLQSLKGLIMLINDSDRITPEEFRMMVKGLKHKVDKTYDFLEGLLLWSKSQMKGFTIRPRQLNIYALVDENISLLQSFADHKQIFLENRVDATHDAFGDEDMVRLVIRNLMANAIKFTDTRGVISVGSSLLGEQLCISVKDNGVGMDAAEIQKLFNSADPFHKNGTKLEKGTGLGLMLCRDFVEKNQGHLTVESKAGEGTVISFTISRRPQPEPVLLDPLRSIE